MGKIQELEDAIMRHRKAYYQGQKGVIVPDEEYDQLEATLRLLDPENSILNQIGDDRVENAGFPKFEHRMMMNSLAKAADKAEFWEWFKKQSDESTFMCEEKIDGSSLELQYDNGKLVHTVTRGDGRIGDEVNNIYAQQIKHVQQSIGDSFTGAIRGEVVLQNSVFRRKYAGENANPRNMCAGIIKRKDGAGCEDLSFIAYDIFPAPSSFERDKLIFLEQNGFTIPRHIECGRLDNNEGSHRLLYGDICAYRDAMQKYRGDPENSSDYNYDGIVVKRNTINIEDMQRDRPQYQIAFKFDLEIAVTELLDVEWYVNGKTRTPVAVFKPVQLYGTTVQHARLHNPRIFREFDLHVGTIVHVSKGGEIIPKIIKSINHDHIGRKFDVPVVCEFCNSKLIDSDFSLYCPNPNCSSVKMHAIAKWITVHDIAYIGDANLYALMQAKVIQDQADLYDLTPERIMQHTSIGNAMAYKICHEIQTVGKETTIPKFVAGLDIEDIGRTLTKLIVKHWNCKSIDDFFMLKTWDISEVSGIGDKTAAVIVEGIKERMPLIKKLLTYVVFKDTDLSPGKLYGKTIVITGIIEGFTRDELQKKIESAGGTVNSSVTKFTTFLVTDEDSMSTKRAKAAKFGVPIISSATLFKMM
jgi:DNA ligase (NAD+)